MLCTLIGEPLRDVRWQVGWWVDDIIKCTFRFGGRWCVLKVGTGMVRVESWFKVLGCEEIRKREEALSEAPCWRGLLVFTRRFALKMGEVIKDPFFSKSHWPLNWWQVIESLSSIFGDTTFSWSWFFGLWLRRVYLFIWRYKRYFLPYLCVFAPPIEIKMFPYMLSWHCWFLCFHLYIRYGFGVASRRKQSELAKTRKDFMNRGQSTSGPRDALKDPLSISFYCLSLFICFAPHFSAASSQNRLWHPHSSHAYSLQLWPSTQTGGLSLGPGFVFSEMRRSLANLDQTSATSHSVGRVLAWPCHSDVVLGLP